ncbi:MAG TPA: GMC family oxidoreductase [Opitutae bacterium]|nr:GMC family oxidoreductase [Opitutae bacterium]
MSNYDVVIVGSGAGGGTMAYALTKQKYRVLLLEAGPKFNPFTDYNLDKESWEEGYFPHKETSEGHHSYAPLQALESKWDDLRSWNVMDGRINKQANRVAYKYHHVRGLGGSTLTFTGESHRLHPGSMQMKTRFGVAADWPLSYEDLEGFYCDAERIVGVAGPESQGERWRSEPYPLPAHPISYASDRIRAAAESLGMTWQANSRAALSKPYDGRPSCNYCANCTRGCPRTDKGSVDVTFLRKATKSGLCQIRTGVTVTYIERSKSDTIRGIRLINEMGEAEFIETSQLVISCGAIETPRLLLASDELANESGQVGRNFMQTLSWSSSGLHSDRLGSFRGLPADSISWDYNAPDSIEGVVGGCRFSVGVHEAGLNGPRAYAKRVVGGWGRAHKDAMRAAFGSVLTVGSIGESIPNAKSFVDLDPAAKDANGVSLARIHSHMDEMEINRLAFMARTCRRILKAAGVEKLVEEYGSYDYFSSTHVFGTCRMGSDAEHSVVDSYGRSHRWKNLTIMDASIFPSSGGGESPSLTIEALALRAAKHFNDS